MELALPVPFCSVLMNTEMATMNPTLMAIATRVAMKRPGWSLNSLTAWRNIRRPPPRGSR